MLHLGAPGFYQWRGTFATYDTKNIDPTQPEVFEFDSRTIPSVSYAGYSITSGNFETSSRTRQSSGFRQSSRQVDVIIGAPRDSDYRGKVYRVQGSNIRQIAIGSQFGEYFGSSLLAIDVNGDLLDDLLVGAPFYSPSRRMKGN